MLTDLLGVWTERLEQERRMSPALRGRFQSWFRWRVNLAAMTIENILASYVEHMTQNLRCGATSDRPSEDEEPHGQSLPPKTVRILGYSPW